MKDQAWIIGYGIETQGCGRVFAPRPVVFHGCRFAGLFIGFSAGRL
jgi:hypothetical protein